MKYLLKRNNVIEKEFNNKIFFKLNKNLYLDLQYKTEKEKLLKRIKEELITWKHNGLIRKYLEDKKEKYKKKIVWILEDGKLIKEEINYGKDGKEYYKGVEIPQKIELGKEKVKMVIRFITKEWILYGRTNQTVLNQIENSKLYMSRVESKPPSKLFWMLVGGLLSGILINIFF